MQSPQVTNQEMNNQCGSGLRPKKMIHNAIDLRPNPEKKNANCFVVNVLPVESRWKFDDTSKELINDQLRCIFEEMGIANKLKKGDSRLLLSINKMLCCDQETGEFETALKRQLEGKLALYLEELDLKTFAEIIGENVLKFRSRKENVKFMLERCFLKSLGINESLKTIQEFCATGGYTHIQKEIKAMTGSKVEDESLFGQELFTAVVKRSSGIIESTGDMKMNIDLQDYKWHDTPVDPGNTSADDHKIFAILIDLDFDTTKENATTKALEPGKTLSADDDHKIVAILLDKDYDRTKENATTRGKPPRKRKKSMHSQGKPPRKRKKSMHSQGELHRNVLNRMLPKLVLDLDVNAVSLFVQEKELFHDTTMHDILEQRTSSDRTRELIKQIQKRDPDTYKKFKECLVEAKQKFLKDLLEEEEQKILGKSPQKRKTSSCRHEKLGRKRKKIKLSDEETVHLNPHLPKVDNSAGPSTDGYQRDIKQRQIESPYSLVTSALEDTLFKGTHDQQQHIPQSMKMVCEQAHKCIRNQEEIVQMVLLT